MQVTHQEPNQAGMLLINPISNLCTGQLADGRSMHKPHLLSDHAVSLKESGMIIYAASNLKLQTPIA